MKMKNYIILAIVLVCLIPYGLAEKTVTSCEDADTINTVRYLNLTIDGTLQEFQIDETKTCPNGCDNVTLSCKPETFKTNLWIIVVIIGFIIFLGVLFK